MIITCPHCQTKYQVAYEAIGSAGRKVQCAQCRQAWQQPAPVDTADEPDRMAGFSAMSEDALDEILEAEARAALAATETRQVQELAKEQARQQAAAAKMEAALMRQRQRAFSRRQNAMAAELPLARTRRSLRVLAVLTLGAVLAMLYFGRIQVVERFPDMAGAYAAMGLGVNVVGLDFSEVTTLRTLRDGKEVLLVSAQIVGLMPEPVVVPAVVVTLIDEEGRRIYEWSVTPGVRDLMAGERAGFDTQLTLPPGDARRVRLSFAGEQGMAVGAAVQSQTTSVEP
jgi:predicted Zn finger-like uncharacterized protein